MNNHPDRTELLKALKIESKEIQSHLIGCQDCRDIFEMLSIFQVSGKMELTNAPVHLISKAVSLLDGKSILEKIKSLTTQLAFDSWANLQPSSVRNSSVLDDRRLQFKNDTFLFDLRAEKQKSQWNFTAQISIDGKQDDAIKIVVGKKEYSVNEFGLIQWSSKTPPKNIKIIDTTTTLELPDISWKL